MTGFIRIRSSRFRVLPDETEENVNEGNLGNSLAVYLQSRFPKRGYDATFACAEDWGWWVGLSGFPLSLGVCAYGRE
jgi:hypothetical protein